MTYHNDNPNPNYLLRRYLDAAHVQDESHKELLNIFH